MKTTRLAGLLLGLMLSISSLSGAIHVQNLASAENSSSPAFSPTDHEEISTRNTPKTETRLGMIAPGVSSATAAPIGPVGVLALLAGVLGFGGWSLRKKA